MGRVVKLGQISGFRRAQRTRTLHLLADSGCGRYAALLLGTTIFTNLLAFMETTVAKPEAERP